MISEFKPKLRRFLLSDLFTSAHGMIQFFTMLFWLIMLSYTDAYYVIYLLVGILGCTVLIIISCYILIYADIVMVMLLGCFATASILVDAK